MNPDHILRDVLVDHAEQRPDAAEVLAEVHQRLNRRQRGRLTRAATVVGAAATVAAVAFIGSAIAGRLSERGGEPTAAGAAATQVSLAPTALPTTAALRGSPAKQSSPRRSSPESTPVRAPQSGYGYSTIAAGWLPGPGHQVGAQNQPGFEERDYAVSVDGVEMDVIIYVESGTHLPARTEAGSAHHDITINGHRAREFVADVATIVAVDLGNGKIAYAGPSVTATTSAVTSARITEIAVHVASDMQFNRHDPIPAGLGAAPTRG